MLPSAGSANAARLELLREMADGRTPVTATMRLEHAGKAFVRAMRDGVALNKHGRRYKPSAIRDIESCLDGHVYRPIGAKRLTDVRRGDVQAIIDAMVAAGKSGSRVRSVVNAIRSLYAWAQDRDLVQHDPASRVRLPAMDAKPRDRVATPAEALALLEVLSFTRIYARRSTPGERLPFALAFFTGARRAEIRHARIDDVDLELGVIYLGADEDGRKSRAALRAVPLIPLVVPMIRRALLERGRPPGDELLCPGDRVRGRNSGMVSFEALQDRADAAWSAAGLSRITAHECRHTFASWLDAAGVRPKVASQLLGHSVARTDGAAVTQRYTHVLPGELERARDQLAAYIAAELEAAAARGTGTG